MAFFMATKMEAILSGKGFHLRNDHRILAQTTETGQICVVDNAFPRCVSPTHQRLVQKTLHRETVKNAVEFQILSFRVAQVQNTGNKIDPFASQKYSLKGARIVLHLGPRFIGYTIASGL